MASVDPREVSCGFTSLWDPPDGEAEDYQSGFVTTLTADEQDDTSRLIANQSGCYAEDWLSYSQYRNELYIIEEEALNEKSCLQVLSILIQKADEEIMKLEEELLMLQCELEWKDEDWSNRCSAALMERIDHLDVLIRNVKGDASEDTNNSSIILSEQLGKLLPASLPDILKPLLETHVSAKRKQKGNCTKEMLACTSKHAQQAEVDESISPVDENEMKNLIMEPNDDNINNLEQPPNFNLHLKSDGRRRMIQDSRKVQKSRSYNRASRSLAKVESTNTKSSETAESGETEDLLVSIGRRRGTKKPMKKLKLETQATKLQNVEALSINKTKSISSSMLEGEGPEKKLKQAHSHTIEKKPRKDARKQVESSCRT